MSSSRPPRLQAAEPSTKALLRRALDSSVGEFGWIPVRRKKEEEDGKTLDAEPHQSTCYRGNPMFNSTPFANQLERSQRTWLAVVLALIACPLMTRLASAEPLVLDIKTDPRYADTMQTFEVTILEEIDQGYLHGFIQECQLRTDHSFGPDWYVAAVAGDDVLKCRSRDSLRFVEMGLKTVTYRGQVRDSLALENLERQVLAAFEPELGYEHRVLFMAGGEAWSEWTPDPIVRTVPVPEMGGESVSEFEVETRLVGASNTASLMSGYIKIKKLDSGG